MKSGDRYRDDRTNEIWTLYFDKDGQPYLKHRIHGKGLWDDGKHLIPYQTRY